ncbi:cob [Acrasis kona]|uniref:Cob n=1 Tax=Acrasis kona TaxID=1008807 RepID=A0AAW2YID4_9EUKA
MSCYDQSNIVFGLISAFILFSQSFFIVIHVISITDMTSGSQSSVFSIDRFYIILYERLSQLVISLLYHLIPKYAVWPIPSLQIVSSALMAISMAYYLPFYNKHTNCFFFSFVVARLVTSIVVLITSTVNYYNPTYIVGTTLSVASLIVFLVCLVISFIGLEIYIYWISRQVQHAEDLLVASSNSDNEFPTNLRKQISVRALEFGLKFALGSRQDTVVQQLDKVVKLAALQNLDSCKLSITRAVMHIYYDEGRQRYASTCLMHALSFNPSLVSQFDIALRMQDLENELGSYKIQKRVNHRLHLAKRKIAEVNAHAKQFWGTIFESSDHDLCSILESMHSKMRDCGMIVNDLATECPKLSKVMELKAEYTRDVKRDFYKAAEIQDVADKLRQEEEELASKRRVAFTQSSLSIPPQTPNNKRQGDFFNSKNQIIPVEESDAFENEDSHQYQDEVFDVEKYTEENKKQLNSTQNQRVDETVKYRKSILRKNHHFLARSILFLFVALFMLLLVASIISSQIAIVINNVQTQFEACRLQSNSYTVLDQMRYNQFQYRLTNTSDPLISTRTAQIQQDITQTVSDVPASSSFTSQLYSFFSSSPEPRQSERTLYDFSIQLQNTLSQLVAYPILNETISNNNFLLLWNNRLTSLNNYRSYCNDLTESYLTSSQSNLAGLISIYVIAAVLLLLVLFTCIPILYCIFTSRRRMLNVLRTIPKTTIKSIHSTISNPPQNYKLHTKRFGSKHKITCSLLLYALGCVLVLICIAIDGGVKINAHQKTYRLVRNAATLSASLRRISFELGELTQQTSFDQLSSTSLDVTPENITLQINSARMLWNSIRFGTSNSASLLGQSTLLDQIIQSDTLCAPSAGKLSSPINDDRNVTISRSPMVYDFTLSCISMNTLLETILSSSTLLVTTYPTLSPLSRFNQRNQTFVMVDLMRYRIEESIIYFFFNPSLFVSGFQFWYVCVLVLIFVNVPCIIYALVHFHMYIAVSHQIRKMIMYVPDKVIDDIPSLRKFVMHDLRWRTMLKTSSDVVVDDENKELNFDYGATSLLQITQEPMLICDQEKIIMNVNSALCEMFCYEDQYELLGKVFDDVLLNHTNLELPTSHMQSTQVGVKKDNVTFPIKLCISMFDSRDGSRMASVLFLDDSEHYNQLKIEKERSDKLLASIVPLAVANKMNSGEQCIAESFPDVTCLQLRLTDFDVLSRGMSALDTVQMLDACVGALDDLCTTYGLEKILKTSTDTYFCVGGMHGHDKEHALRAVKFAQEAVKAIKEVSDSLNVCIGIHTGSIMAGVVGRTKFCYDVWGETSEMTRVLCDSCEVGRILCSDTVQSRLTDIHFKEHMISIMMDGYEHATMKAYLLCTEEDQVEDTDQPIQRQTEEAYEPITQPPTPILRDYEQRSSPLSRPITPIRTTLGEPNKNIAKKTGLPPLRRYNNVEKNNLDV